MHEPEKEVGTRSGVIESSSQPDSKTQRKVLIIMYTSYWLKLLIPVDVREDENTNVNPGKHHEWSDFFLPDFLQFKPLVA